MLSVFAASDCPSLELFCQANGVKDGEYDRKSKVRGCLNKVGDSPRDFVRYSFTSAEIQEAQKVSRGGEDNELGVFAFRESEREVALFNRFLTLLFHNELWIAVDGKPVAQAIFVQLIAVVLVLGRAAGDVYSARNIDDCVIQLPLQLRRFAALDFPVVPSFWPESESVRSLGRDKEYSFQSLLHLFAVSVFCLKSR